MGLLISLGCWSIHYCVWFHVYCVTCDRPAQSTLKALEWNINISLHNFELCLVGLNLYGPAIRLVQPVQNAVFIHLVLTVVFIRLLVMGNSFNLTNSLRRIYSFLNRYNSTVLSIHQKNRFRLIQIQQYFTQMIRELIHGNINLSSISF